MKKSLLLSALLIGLVGCTAPQGQKLAANAGLAPVATGPATKAATLTLNDAGEFVNLDPNATITVKLPASYSRGYSWRLAEIPDPTVLKLVSREFTPGATPAQSGEETMVFQATGPGDVRVKMWYGTLWASDMNTTRDYEFIASVNAESQKPAKKKKSAKKA